MSTTVAIRPNLNKKGRFTIHTLDANGKPDYHHKESYVESPYVRAESVRFDVHKSLCCKVAETGNKVPMASVLCDYVEPLGDIEIPAQGWTRVRFSAIDCKFMTQVYGYEVESAREAILFHDDKGTGMYCRGLAFSSYHPCPHCGTDMEPEYDNNGSGDRHWLYCDTCTNQEEVKEQK